MGRVIARVWLSGSATRRAPSPWRRRGPPGPCCAQPRRCAVAVVAAAAFGRPSQRCSAAAVGATGGGSAAAAIGGRLRKRGWHRGDGRSCGGRLWGPTGVVRGAVGRRRRYTSCRGDAFLASSRARRSPSGGGWRPNIRRAVVQHPASGQRSVFPATVAPVPAPSVAAAAAAPVAVPPPPPRGGSTAPSPPHKRRATTTPSSAAGSSPPPAPPASRPRRGRGAPLPPHGGNRLPSPRRRAPLRVACRHLPRGGRCAGHGPAPRPCGCVARTRRFGGASGWLWTRPLRVRSPQRCGRRP